MATRPPPSGLPTITATGPRLSDPFDYTTLGYDPGAIDSMVREEMQGGEGVVSYGETYRDVVVDALARLGLPSTILMGLPQEEINKLYDAVISGNLSSEQLRALGSEAIKDYYEPARDQQSQVNQTEMEDAERQRILEDTLQLLEEGDQQTALSDQQRVAALEQVQSGLGQINLEDGLDAGETEYLYQVLNQRIFSPEDIASTLGIPVEDVIGGFNTMATERQGSLLPVTQASTTSTTSTTSNTSTTPNVSTTPATPTAEPSIWGSIQQSVNRVGREIGRGMDMVFDVLGIPKPNFSVIQPNMPGGTVIWGQPQGGSVFGRIGTTPGSMGTRTVVGVQTGIPILDILIGKAADVISGRVAAGDVTFTPEDIKQVLEDSAEQVLNEQGLPVGDLGDLTSILGDLKDIGTQVLTRNITPKDEENNFVGIDFTEGQQEEDKVAGGVDESTVTGGRDKVVGVTSPAYDPYTGSDVTGGRDKVIGVTSPAYDPYTGSDVTGGDEVGGGPTGGSDEDDEDDEVGGPPGGSDEDDEDDEDDEVNTPVYYDPYTDGESSPPDEPPPPETPPPEEPTTPPPPEPPPPSGGGFFGMGFGSTPGRTVIAPTYAETYSYDPFSSQIIQGPRAEVYAGADAVMPASGPQAGEDVVQTLEQGQQAGLEGQDLFEYLINMLKGEDDREQDIFKTGFAAGGEVGVKGMYLGGRTDGMADKIPANINNVEPVKLSDGEFVIPADVVSHLGNGNSDAGAEVLYDMLEHVRTARTGTPEQGRQINPYEFIPRVGRYK